MKAPSSRRNLDAALQRIASGNREGYLRIRAVVSNTVVSQMLPDGAVKGGSGLKLRLGDRCTRFTTDLDIARAATMDAFAKELDSALSAGWGGFTGRLVEKEPAHPKGVPTHYVMQPYEVKLSYNGKAWCTVTLEVGHNEIGDADDPDWGIAQDVVELFERLGLPCPAPVPLMPMPHQIAQKLHALTESGSHRAHDLIDLQLIEGDTQVDLIKTRNVCARLFAYRKAQQWPPRIICGDDWATAYDAQRADLPVLPSVEAAVNWANELIVRIDSAGL